MAQAKRKKRFFDVEMPVLGKATQLFGYEMEELNGKTITYDLTRMLRGKSYVMTLKVVADTKTATAEPRSVTLLQYYMRKIVRKGTNYIEDSFKAKCLDDEVEIKPFMVTRRKVSQAVRKAIRELAKEEIVKYLTQKNSADIFDDILKNQLQKQISVKVKKIYPLSACEIRTFKIIRAQKE